MFVKSNLALNYFLLACKFFSILLIPEETMEKAEKIRLLIKKRNLIINLKIAKMKRLKILKNEIKKLNKFDN